MREIGRMGAGTIIFLIGAAIYLINLLIGLAGRGRTIPVDGIGLMVLGLGLSLLLKW